MRTIRKAQLIQTRMRVNTVLDGWPVRVVKMAGRQEQPKISPTDEEPIASLLNPGCGIPPDIHFEVYDEEGTMLGLLGGHKNLMALKSPVFKTMFYGALKECGDTVQIKDTSLGAFKALLRYIHEDTFKEEDEYWCKMGIVEVIKIADLAEKYHLPGLKSKTVAFAKSFQFPKENLLETFSLAESTPFPEFSEALLQNCDDFLLATLATPTDYDKFVKEHSQESAALRLLARVDFGKMAFVDTRPCSILLQEAVSCMRKIKRSIRPRHHLKKLIRNIREVKEGNEYNGNWYNGFYEADPGVPNLEEYREMILSLSDSHLVTVKLGKFIRHIRKVRKVH